MKLYLEVNNNCFLKCAHCQLFSGHVLNRNNQSIDIEFVRRLASEAERLGVKSVVLTGGEPLMAPLLPEFVKIFKEKGFHVSIESSLDVGSGTFQSLKNLCHKCKPDKVIVNISSLNDAFYGVKGHVKRVFDNIVYLILKDVTVEAKTVITSLLSEELPKMYRFFALTGVQAVHFERLFFRKRLNENLRQLVPSRENWKEITAGILEMISDYGNTIETHIPASLNLLRAKLGARPLKCPAFNDRIYITHTRLLTGCFGFKNESSFLKNFDRDSLVKVVKKAAEETKTDRVTYCENCRSFERCLGGCPAKRYINTGYVSAGPDPMCFSFDVVKLKHKARQEMKSKHEQSRTVS